VIPAADALERLREGNARFVSNISTLSALSTQSRRAALVAGQNPFATVLGCSDSRVPAELVFDQGFGDLFVIRVAGNIVAPSQVGSVEFAASRFGTRLVVVMGHSQCGAVIATLEDVLGAAPHQSRSLRSIVNRIRPAVEPLVASQPGGRVDTYLGQAVRANVHAAVRQLRRGSPILEELSATRGLLIVGAEYILETGIVEFFEPQPTLPHHPDAQRAAAVSQPRP
jgi:carbonic anhydrase